MHSGSSAGEGALPEVGEDVRLAEALAHPGCGGAQQLGVHGVGPGDRERERPAVAASTGRLLGEAGDEAAPVEQPRLGIRDADDLPLGLGGAATGAC